LKKRNIKNATLFVGDMFNTPLKDNSIDIVYTSHTIEPNGGKEFEALQELYRVTGKYLVLLEPTFEFAGEIARKRMKSLGYTTQLYSTVKELGFKVVEHRLFDVSVEPVVNPTGLIVIEKNESVNAKSPLCCPITKTDIILKKGAYFSPEGLLAYPIIDDIPCLMSQNAIVATKFMETI